MSKSKGKPSHKKSSDKKFSNKNSSGKKSSGEDKNFKGRIKRNPDGFGFFVSESDEIEDIYIPKEQMKGVFSNDLVEISVNRKGGKFGTRGQVNKIIERSAIRYVGRLCYNDNNSSFYLKDSSHSWGQTLSVANPEKHSAGELVLVEIEKFPNLGQIGKFEAKIVSALGRSVDPNTDNIRILHESKVPVEFSKKAIEQAESLGSEVQEKDKKGRKDLRKTPLVTIDGVTAKDFDDAIYVEKLKSGYKLIVAIADVSHYVEKGTVLDKEAYDKGTSVYLANYVCPMLPEAISNGLCSLNPHVDRLCFCCEMEIDSKGEIKKFDFYEAVMNSHARVTYGEAQELIEDGLSEFSKEVQENILTAGELAQVLNAKRMEEGSVDFDVPSVKVLVDDAGEATDLVKEERIFAHRLIEELMLATNICASKFLEKHKRPQLYRIHESPEQEDLIKLQNVLKSFLNMNFGKIKNSHDFQKLSEKLIDMNKPALKDIAQTFILRSMKQAQYSGENFGHFGLSFSHYAHFTSPIRRYPDLVIHRQIKSALNNEQGYPQEDVSTMGAILSAAEQRAVKAERKVTSIKKARFFERYVGQDFDGYISSLAKFGLFVTLIEFPLDGLVKVDDLSGDFFVYDEETLTLKGKRTGKLFKAGDKVRVKVAQVSVDEGKIDFELISHLGQKAAKDSGSRGRGQSKYKGKKHDGKRSDKKLDKKSGKKSHKKSYEKSGDKSSDKPHEKSKKPFNKKGSDDGESRTNENRSSKKTSKGKKPSGAASMFSSSSNARSLSFSKNKNKKKK